MMTRIINYSLGSEKILKFTYYLIAVCMVYILSQH